MTGSPRAFNCDLVPKNCYGGAIRQLLSQNLESRVVYPAIYRAASGEVFGITLGITWAITLIFHPEQIFMHPARFVIGSYNPCFGWDYPPASYIALFLCSVNVYLLWRHAWLDLTRSHLMSKRPGHKLTWTQEFSKWASIALALSANFWLLLWVIGPVGDKTKDGLPGEHGNWLGHTALFILYAVCTYLATLGNFLEIRASPLGKNITTKHNVYIIVFGISSLWLPTVYLWALFMAEPGTPPPLPAWVTQTADFFWLGSIMSMDWGSPKDYPLLQEIKLLEPEDAQGLLEEDAKV